MSQDFYSTVTQSRLNMLAAEEQAALADLAAHKANSDPNSASTALQQLANVRAERANLLSLHQEYQASMQPPQQPEQTPEEINAKPWHRMTPDDALSLARTSKYGRDLDWNNPHVRAGWAESQRRKARGE